MVAAGTTTNTSFGPERQVLLHSPDPIDLGLRLEYSIADGRVRIVYTEENNDDQQQLPQPNNDGVVEGTVHNGDVVLEAAGVNMRRPISDHMWKLTEGLMKVAPRPIEIIVATEKDGNEAAGTAMTTATTDVVSEMDQDGMASVYGASVYGTYYQLELGAHARTTDATLHHLPGEECNSEESDNEDQLQSSEVVVRNPFEDIDRFGTERRIIFHTQSLGVKLHRSPSEGIVHILTVTPYKPFGDATNNGEKPVREGPDNGYLEAGDTIFEVGGVDLRGKVIGKLEWADMVHFIKHVHRPLDMIVAKDKLFTLERAGVTKDVLDDLSNKESEKAVDCDQAVVVEAPEDNAEQRDDPEPTSEHQEHSQMFDNTCFNISVDDICNLPCGGDRRSNVPSSPTREDTSWIKSSLPESKVHPWNNKKDVHDDDMESVIEEVASSANKYAPSITNIIEEEEHDKINDDAKPDSRPPKMNFFSRTDPKGKPSLVHTSSPMVPISPMTTIGAAAAAAPAMMNPIVESEILERKLTVSQLREMFSPIQSKAPGDGTSIAKTNLKPVSDGATSEQVRTNSALLNGLFSPIVAEATTSKSPAEGTDNILDQLALNGTAIMNNSAPDSPGDWSTKSPLSDKSIGSPVADSNVADVRMSEERSEDITQDATQSVIHADGSVEDIISVDVKSMVHSDGLVEDVAPPAFNINIDKEETCRTKEESRIDSESVAPHVINSNISKEELATVPSIVEAHTNDSKPESRPHMPFYARTHPKGKSSVIQQTSPVRTSPIARMVVNQIQAPSLQSSPPKPNDETKDSSFHSTVLHNLKDEFNSQERALHSPESRDDRAEDDASNREPGVGSMPSSQMLHPELSVQPPQQRHDLSPTGSTITVEDKNATAKKSSADATFFGERFFHAMDAADSPFVGNIKFATPNQRVPASALFSEAFLVQKPSTVNNVHHEPINVRWDQTDSPLFITKKKIDDRGGDKVGKPPGDIDDNLIPIPGVKRVNNISGFNMTNLEEGLSLIDCDPESESPSFELNDTIVYADSTEEAQQQCCAMSNLCGSDTMFEGLVQNCVDVDSHRKTKERVNKIPSPRRKNLLDRIRNKKKKSRLESEKTEYGTLDDEEINGKQKEEKMKGIRKAKVQLTFQNMRGQTLASATQFALLMDDEISF